MLRRFGGSTPPGSGLVRFVCFVRRVWPGVGYAGQRASDHEGICYDHRYYARRGDRPETWRREGRCPNARLQPPTRLQAVPACCVSILATIQPGPLQSYLFDAVNGGRGDDGLMPRFQLAVWPDVSGDWRNVDRWPDTPARQQAFEVIESLADLEPFTIDAEHDDHSSVPFLRFHHDAQAEFNSWRGDLERTLRKDSLSAALEAVLAKHRSLVPSLALLIHLADGGRGPVKLSALDRAVGWAQYLFAHARRIYAVVPTAESEQQAELIDFVRRKGGTVTTRDVAHGMRRYRNDPEGAEADLTALAKAGQARWQTQPPGPRGGRAVRVFWLLPSVTVTTTPAKPGRHVGFGDGDALDEARINTLLAAAADTDVDLWPT